MDLLIGRAQGDRENRGSQVRSQHRSRLARVIRRRRFVGIDSANPELRHEPLPTNITMSDPHSASTNALIA